MSFLILVGAAASAATPHHHAPRHSAPTHATVPVKPAMDPQIIAAMMMKMMDKLMPAGPDPDPARLAAARGTIDVMWQKGTLGSLYLGMIDGMVDRGLALHETDFAEMTGKKVDAKASPLTFRQTLTAKDPRFEQKLASVRQLVAKELGKVSDVIEPGFREGLARSVARRFDAKQIADINAFLATPTGHAFGPQAMQLWFDPDVFRGMIAAFPQLIKLGPDMARDFQAAMMQMDAKAVPATAPPAPSK